MQIVIDIPEELYKRLTAVRGEYYLEDGEDLCEAVQHGTPLPKGHGRLIDADKLLASDRIIADSRKCHYISTIDVYQAPTIIDADKESD